ncbi:hypothetical protein [Brevibacillus sp. FSL L8-0710]|uniref:hypothetical protein n=1 Tax=Brevibacillus sp. FSL L8-0710 TaxID=2975313 RepID=UPI0030F5C8E7
MGYMTWYRGKFTLNKPLDDETYELLIGLATTRRMQRDPKKLEEMGYGKAECFGEEGEYFYNPNDFEEFGQTWDDSILDYNNPPVTQPWLWLKWIPTEDRMAIEWNGERNTYYSELWIEYLVERVLKPRGYVLNGIVEAEGEWQCECQCTCDYYKDRCDCECSGECVIDNWWIKVRNNHVSWTPSPRHGKPIRQQRHPLPSECTVKNYLIKHFN